LDEVEGLGSFVEIEKLTEILQFSTYIVTISGETALIYRAKQTLPIAELGDVLL
jgi:adenylate cyclase class IV